MIKRLNITIPESLAKKIDKLSNKSQFITEAVKEKLEKIEVEKLKKELEEGYRATRIKDQKVNKEWEKITLEGWE